ncbi:MAG: helix-turn-helix transcriptional regulator [Candidatus Hydrogenedentes bacterium]|nr:helix-turn-helix transcriptional regulator [Candidatus Hydrogenedentota bacterium]
METMDAIGALQSLAQETRLAVFRLLVRAGHGGMTAGDIAGALDVPGPTLSFHLKHLCHAGLITCRRDGRSLWYRVEFEQVRLLLAYLMEDCCQGNPAVCGDGALLCGISPGNDGDEHGGCC